MTTHVAYRGPDGHLVDISERVRKFGGITVTENAEEMDAAQSTIILDDEDGTLAELHGYRVFACWEDEVPGDDQFFFVGYVVDKIIRRGQYRTGASRVWEVQVADINSIFGRRTLLGEDAARPAESDVERVAWWNGSTFGSLIDDERYLFADNEVDLDAQDFSLQQSDSLLHDAMEASGKNLYATYFADLFSDADNPWGNYSIWYGTQDREDYSSAIRLSNVLSDLDLDAVPRECFEVLQSAELHQDPTRVFSRNTVPYDGGYETNRNAATETEFALSGRDAVQPSINVKSSAKAAARAARYSADLATEEDTITVEFYAPRAQVNDLRPGMRVQVRVSHFPGYEASDAVEDWPWLRVINRTVSNEDADDRYKIRVQLSAPPAAPFVAVVAADLSIGSSSGREQHWSSALGIPPATLVVGKQYRLVATVLYHSDVGSGLTYGGGPCNLLGRQQDTTNAPEVRVSIAGSATKIDAPTYTWTPGDGTTTPTQLYEGIGWQYQGTAGTDFPCGLPTYSTGIVSTGDWLTFDGPSVSADVAITGTPISGFYGHEWGVHVELQRRDAP